MEETDDTGVPCFDDFETYKSNEINTEIDAWTSTIMACFRSKDWKEYSTLLEKATELQAFIDDEQWYTLDPTLVTLFHACFRLLSKELGRIDLMMVQHANIYRHACRQGVNMPAVCVFHAELRATIKIAQDLAKTNKKVALEAVFAVLDVYCIKARERKDDQRYNDILDACNISRRFIEKHIGVDNVDEETLNVIPQILRKTLI
jgi:hypothetical protein